MLTEFSISSIQMNIIIRFRLERNPKTPMLNIIALKTIYQLNGTITHSVRIQNSKLNIQNG
jgi:hypothetical protein